MGTASATPHPHRRILLVEDDVDLREVLAAALERHGHEVFAVEDGRAALDQMRQVHPDIVLLDLMMPGMNGWQFRVEQRRDPSLAETPIVAMSANSSETAAAVDADIYLEKPFSTSTVLRAIEDVLRAHDRRLEPGRVAQNERMAALGTLAAGVAHEINNPLTYVLLHLSRITRELPSLATDDNRDKIEQLSTLVAGALEGAERIRGITVGIRAMSRMDDQSRSLLAIEPVLDAAIRLVSNELRHRARLITDHHDTPHVMANEGRLGQVFLNLLTNAVQAIPEGDADAHQIRVSTRTRDDGWAIVEISDTGEGVPPHLIGRLFEPFFTTKATGEGTGLGLSISHGIVRSLGGEIEVTSELGRGTTFRVSLPPARAGAMLEHHAPPVVTSVPTRRRILVVDDEPAIGEAIRDALAGEHDVVLATSGRRALDLLVGGDRFDVILSDLHMPDLSGMDLYARLRAIRPRLASRMIFMTAGAFTDRARAFVGGGKHPMLEKPVDLDRLREVLTSWSD